MADTLNEIISFIKEDVLGSKPLPGEPLLEIIVSDAELNCIFDPVADWQLPFVEVVEDQIVVGETQVCRNAEGHPTKETSLRPRWNQRFLFRASGARFYRFQVCVEHFIRVRTVVGECGFAAADAWATAASMEGPVALSCQIIRRGQVTGTLNLVLFLHDAAHEAHALREVEAAQHQARQQDDGTNPHARRKLEKRKTLWQFYQYNWSDEDLLKQSFGSALFLAHPVRGVDVHRHSDKKSSISLAQEAPSVEQCAFAIDDIRREEQEDTGLGKSMSWEIGVDDVEEGADDHFDDEVHQPDLLNAAFHHMLVGDAYREEDMVEFALEDAPEASYPRSSEEEKPLRPPTADTGRRASQDLPRYPRLSQSQEANAAPYDQARYPPPQNPGAGLTAPAALMGPVPTSPLGQTPYPMPGSGPGLTGPTASLGPPPTSPLGPPYPLPSAGSSLTAAARGPVPTSPLALAPYPVPSSGPAAIGPAAAVAPRPSSLPGKVQYPVPSSQVDPLGWSAVPTATTIPQPTVTPVTSVPTVVASMGPSIITSAGSLGVSSAAQLPKMRLPSSSAPAGAFTAPPYGTSRSQVSEAQRQQQRQMAADKAQLRQEQSLARGIGDVQKAKDMQDRAHKETLLGRIDEHYAKLKERTPNFLRMANLEQLQQHMKGLQGRAPYSSSRLMNAQST